MNILLDIAEFKRQEVAARKKTRSVESLMQSISFHRKSIPFGKALSENSPIGIIAEIKRSSPSAGVIRSKGKPADLAVQYQKSGAAAISVLTDEKFFSGSLKDLATVRDAVNIPILRKDFIIDEYQVIEAKASGADAILLIAAILEKRQISDLHAAASGVGLETLVELYECSEIDILDLDKLKLIGINNRDLRTFRVDTDRALQIASHLPGDILRVAESGINSPEIIRKYIAGGIGAVLIGEHLMKADLPGKALKFLIDGITDEASG